MIAKLMSLVLAGGLAWGIEKGDVRIFSQTRADIYVGKAIPVRDVDGQEYTAVITEIFPSGSPVDFQFTPVESAPANSNLGSNGAPANAKTSAPGGGGGRGEYSLGRAVGAGLAAGAVRGTVGAAVNIFVLTPKWERQYRAAVEAQREAEAGLNATRRAVAAAQARTEILARAVDEGLKSRPGWADVKFPEVGGRAPQPWETKNPGFDGRAEAIEKGLSRGAAPFGPPGELKSAGLFFLTAASRAFLAGDFVTSEFALMMAQKLADLFVGLDPISGTVRSGYELYTGKNMITGEELTPSERKLAGVIFTTSIVTAGATSSLAESVRIAGKILGETKVASQALGESAKVIEQLEKLGWSSRKIQQLGEFGENVLGPQIQNLDTTIAAFESWKVSSKMSFPAVLKSLNGSKNELALMAEKAGVEVSVLAERRATAIGFINDAPEMPQVMEERLVKIYRELRGIDLGKDVSAVKLKRGTKLKSWKHPETPVGQYFMVEPGDPHTFGIGHLAKLKNGPVFAKDLATSTLKEDAWVMKSVTAEIPDTWSIHIHSGLFLEMTKEGVMFEGVQHGTGGALQYYVPNRVLE